MFEQILYALFFAAIPIFLFSAVIFWWFESRNKKKGKPSIFDESLDEAELKLEEDENDHSLQGKWLTFGGGFYGMVGLLTYLVSEWQQLVEMIANFEGFEDGFVRPIIRFIIHFVIESFTNIVDAVTWPLFWMKKLEGASVWILFLAAYAGYIAAYHLLKRRNRQNSED